MFNRVLFIRPCRISYGGFISQSKVLMQLKVNQYRNLTHTYNIVDVKEKLHNH